MPDSATSAAFNLCYRNLTTRRGCAAQTGYPVLICCAVNIAVNQEKKKAMETMRCGLYISQSSGFRLSVTQTISDEYAPVCHLVMSVTPPSGSANDLIRTMATKRADVLENFPPSQFLKTKRFPSLNNPSRWPGIFFFL